MMALLGKYFYITSENMKKLRGLKKGDKVKFDAVTKYLPDGSEMRTAEDIKVESILHRDRNKFLKENKQNKFLLKGNKFLK